MLSHLRTFTRRLLPASAALSACVLVAGCVNLGPDPSRPPSVLAPGDGGAAEPYRYASAEQQAQPPQITRWWQRFGDDHTDELVQQALTHNTDVRAAAARVLQAEALLGVATGRRFPAVGADGSVSRSQSTFEFFGDRQSTRSTTYTLELNVGWQVDLFGKLRRQQQAAYLNMLATSEDRQALMHTIIAQVVRTRAQIAVLQRQLAIIDANITSFEQTRDVVDRRYQGGITSAFDLRLAGENVAAARARRPNAVYRLRAAQLALDVLLGRQPGTSEPLEDGLPELPPAALPDTGLPAALLDRRPDLRASALRAAAEQADIGVAIADLFPDLSIGISGGLQSSRLGDLIDARSYIWGLIAQTTTRLFEGGALRANVDAARAEAEALAANYAGQVLTAISEVEDALIRERTAREAYVLLQQRLTEAREAERIAGDRYDQGVESILSVLEAERRRRLAEDELIATQLTIWNARIDLYLALGGDWGVEPTPLDEMIDREKLGAWRGVEVTPQRDLPGQGMIDLDDERPGPLTDEADVNEGAGDD